MDLLNAWHFCGIRCRKPAYSPRTHQIRHQYFQMLFIREVSTLRLTSKGFEMSSIVGRIFLTIGLVLASAGGYCFWSTQDLLKNGLRSPGKVVELRKPPASRYYTPVVQFEASDHRIITTACKTGSNPPTHKVADSVTVIYRVTSPEVICLDEPLELWLLTCIFGGLGLVFIVVGGGMLIHSKLRA